jgi:hypothetical protein
MRTLDCPPICSGGNKEPLPRRARPVTRVFEGWSHTKEQLHQELTERLENFYSTKVQVSGGGRDRLASPGGPEDADLGIILHLQSEEDAISNFWDPRSATIRLLEEKGISDEFTFGYDWHWRAEETFDGRTTCPAKRWSRDLWALHSKVSTDILEILPLPFLITGSGCTRENLCRNLSKATKRLEIPIVPPIGVLKLDLDFRHGTLRRMIVHIHHPSAGFFANAKSKPGMAVQIDAGLNFFLWLTGRKYDADSFGRAYSRRCPRSRKAAPLAEMYAYVRKESKEQRLLHLAEYAPCFRSWAGRYLQEDPATVLSRGDSLAGAAVRKIGRKISIARRRQSKKNSTAANSNKSLVSGPPKNRGLKGRHLKAQRGDRAPTSADDKYQQEADEVTPMTIWANSDKDAGDDQAFQSAPVHRPSIDEVDIPLPIDDQYEDHSDGGASSEAESEADGDQTSGPVLFHGKKVVVLRSGVVKLIKSSRHIRLRFRLSNKVAKRILGLAKDPTVHFSPQEVNLRIDDHIVYRKSIERLLASVEGAEWLIQIVHELEALQGKPAPADDSERKAPGDELPVPAHDSRLGSNWKNGELRRRLRHGSIFPCARIYNKTKIGRVYFRSIQLHVPEEADFDTVFIQCDLAPNGSRHSNACATSLRADDAANRLGVKLRFNSKVDNKEKELWAVLGGECNTKKLNSLVDFLEDKDEGWTERQPRRFLGKNKFLGRMKPSYTA